MLVMQDMVNNGNYSFMKDTALPTVGMKKKNDIFNMRMKSVDNWRLPKMLIILPLKRNI